MTRRMNDEAFMEARDAARCKADDKAYAKLSARMDAAEAMIGQLVREDRTVHYVYPVGGRYREGSRMDMIDFLMRNHYA